LTRAPDRLSISVVICCFNSEQRLPKVLQHLLRQKVDASVSWEVIVVDNASSDATANVPQTFWPMTATVPLRIVEEKRQGLSYARRRGAGAAEGAVVGYLDDDNWVSENWVQRVHDIFDLHPDIGACGGRGVAVFESTEPSWFALLQRSYAVGPQSLSGGYIRDELGWLGGAGLCIRRSALLALFDAGFENLNRGRTGRSLASGEDMELCLALRLAGWQLYYDPELVFCHHIPQLRVTPSYRRRLHFAFGRTDVALTHYHAVLNIVPSAQQSRDPKQALLREWYWAIRRLVRLLVRPPARKACWLPYRMNVIQHSGFFWELIRSSRSFEAHRRQVFVLARRLRDLSAPLPPTSSSSVQRCSAHRNH